MKTYSKPTMIVVKIQHRGIICVSDPVTSLGGNSGMTLGGSDTSYDGDIRTKESSSIWDEEW